MRETVIRPAADSKKIRTSSSFELCYLRHQYLRRVKFNPTPEEMEPYMKIVQHFTKNTFFTYFNLFKAVGMYHEDVLNIGRVHLVSFLGLYSIEQMKVKGKEWFCRFSLEHKKDPEPKDFEQKNKANFTMFFKQRMEDLVRVCRQKVRNIKGQPSEEYIAFCGSVKPPRNPRKILKDPEQFGFKKVEFSIFKSIRKKVHVEKDASIFQFNEKWYVSLALDQKNLDLDDIIGSGSDPYENYHNMKPDDLFEKKEEEKKFENYHRSFSNRSTYRKKAVLRNFIAKNRSKAQYREEIAAAKKLLKTLGD